MAKTEIDGPVDGLGGDLMGEKRRKEQKKKKLLDAGNDRCPICWQPLVDSKDITIEHVPTKFLGGHEACLTCRSCNNGFSKIEEFMRRDIQGTTRMPLYEGARRIAASDVVLPSKRSDPFVVETKENLWLSEGDNMPMSALARANQLVFQTPSRQEVLKAWIKSFYLMAGCDRSGEAWSTTWAPRVRSYLQGNRPWNTEVGVFRKNDPEKPAAPLAPSGVVGRLHARQRTDVFFASWREYACFFGLSEIPTDGVISPVKFQWLDEGPFVYGEPPSVCH